MNSARMVTMVMLNLELRMTVRCAHVRWVFYPTISPQNVRWEQMEPWDVSVKKGTMDQGVKVVPMVSMETHRSQVTTVSAALVVATLTQMLMAAVTQQLGSV